MDRRNTAQLHESSVECGAGQPIHHPIVRVLPCFDVKKTNKQKHKNILGVTYGNPSIGSKNSR